MGFFDKVATPIQAIDEKIKIAGLAQLSKIKAVINSLSSIASILESDIKSNEITREFVSQGLRYHERPENFRGWDEEANASCELRRRGSNSPLKKEEIEILESYNIPYDEVEKSPEYFAISQQYQNDKELLDRIEKLLSSDPTIPKDLFAYFPAETKRVVTDETINEVFKKRQITTIEKLLSICTVIAVKPTLGRDLTSADITETLALIDAE